MTKQIVYGIIGAVIFAAVCIYINHIVPGSIFWGP